MATLTVQVIDRTGNGLTPARTAAAAGGDEFPNSGREFLEIVNGGGAPITVTAVTPQQVAGLAVSDETYTVANNTVGVRIGPFPPGTFNNPATGRVALTYSAVTSVTVDVLRVG